jgi:7-cyano-7-deazaguanine reductase
MPSSTLETFPNQFPTREYEVEITCPEFTAVCPKTGQPDFGSITIAYVPAGDCIELKSLKLYLFEFRDRGIFYEHAVNTILDDLVTACRPRRMTVVGQFNPRGGITTRISARFDASASPARLEPDHPGGRRGTLA